MCVYVSSFLNRFKIKVFHFEFLLMFFTQRKHTLDELYVGAVGFWCVRFENKRPEWAWERERDREKRMERWFTKIHTTIFVRFSFFSSFGSCVSEDMRKHQQPTPPWADKHRHHHHHHHIYTRKYWLFLTHSLAIQWITKRCTQIRNHSRLKWNENRRANFELKGNFYGGTYVCEPSRLSEDEL